jgi:TatA/E family protein of Tat protein translocase
MFGSIGMPELVIIFVVALIVFGPRRLPELGRSFGRAISEFKRAAYELRTTVEDEIEREQRQAAVPSQPATEEPAQRQQAANE